MLNCSSTRCRFAVLLERGRIVSCKRAQRRRGFSHSNSLHRIPSSVASRVRLHDCIGAAISVFALDINALRLQLHTSCSPSTLRDAPGVSGRVQPIGRCRSLHQRADSIRHPPPPAFKRRWASRDSARCVDDLNRWRGLRRTRPAPSTGPRSETRGAVHAGEPAGALAAAGSTAPLAVRYMTWTPTSTGDRPALLLCPKPAVQQDHGFQRDAGVLRDSPATILVAAAPPSCREFEQGVHGMSSNPKP